MQAYLLCNVQVGQTEQHSFSPIFNTQLPVIIITKFNPTSVLLLWSQYASKIWEKSKAVVFNCLIEKVPLW